MEPYASNNVQELLERVHEGDELAFRELFYKYKSKLFSFLLDITKSKYLAEDMLQDVFLKIWQNRLRMRDVKNLDA